MALFVKLWVSIVAASAALFIVGSPAMASITFGSFGSGPGQTSRPAGLAVDPASGRLYVADSGNNRVDVFGFDGEFLTAFGWGVINGNAELQACTVISGCLAGSSGSGSGQLGTPTALTVDDGGDIYVYDSENHRVEKFAPSGAFSLMFGDGVNQTSGGDVCPRAGFPSDVCGAGSEGTGKAQLNDNAKLAFSPEGLIHVAERPDQGVAARLQKFSLTGEYVEEIALPAGEGAVRGIAPDPGGAFYIGKAGDGHVWKFPPTGPPPICEFNPSFNIGGLATDSLGNLFVADSTGGIGTIYRYDSNCILDLAFGYGDIASNPEWMAAHHSVNGDLFTSQGSGQSSRIVYVSLPPAGPIVLPGRTQASSVGNVKATLSATINPEGSQTSDFFEYVDDATCQKGIQESGNCFAHGEKTLAAPVGADFKLHQMETEVGCLNPEDEAEVPQCLIPETLYHIRAVATNSQAPTGAIGEEATFETKPALEITATYATNVSSDSAVLNATIDALGIPTAGFFEYVDDATCQRGLEEAANCFDHANVTGSIDFGSGEAVTRSAQILHLETGTLFHYRLVASDPLIEAVRGPERTFTTFRDTALPTCLNDAFRGGLSAKLPNCRAFEMVTPVNKENGDIVVLLATDNNIPAELPRASVNGDKLTYSSYRPFADAQSAPYSVQYLASRQESGWLNHSISPPREGASVYPARGLDTQYKMFSENLCDGWLLQDAEPVLGLGGVKDSGNLYRRDNCGGESYEALTTVEPTLTEPPEEYVPELVGASAGGAVTVFRANDRLTDNAASKAGIYQLYARSSDGLRLVSVLPNGDASMQSSTAGTGGAYGFRRGRVAQAVSADGERIFWTNAIGPGQIYLRTNPFASGAECSTDAPCTLPVSASVAGEGAGEPAQFWTAATDGSKALFSFTAGALAGNLYEYEVESKTAKLIAKGTQSLLGASKDASRVYFISKNVLAPGGIVGNSNIYFYEAGETPVYSLVATSVSANVGTYCSAVSTEIINHCERVNPDGSHLAFTSAAPLTGYDNLDAKSGEADAEVFLYDAITGGAGSLRCVSCNPTGARPVGRAVQRGGGSPVSVAAKIPFPNDALHSSRALSDDGRRLFFESFDALVPRDNNGVEDVYEWEAASSRTECEVAGSGVYSASAGGCLSLISSGQSAEDSEFVDASSGGSDVFFKTEESLLPQDSGLIDIYDARAQGGFIPITPPTPPCEGEACQPTQRLPALMTPSSATFNGPGNVPKSKGSSKGKKKKHKKKKQKRASARHPRGASR